MSSTENAPRRVEVPVKRVEVTITLEQVLDAVAKYAASMPGRPGVPAPTAEVGARLQKLGELATEMKSVLGELGTLDPNVHAQLQGQGPAAGQ